MVSIRRILGAIALLSAGLLPALCPAQEAKPGRYHVMCNGYYAREVKDQEWHLTLVGEIPSQSGAYVVVHDAQGKCLHHGAIPQGKYPPEKPYLVTIKPDGVTGDYKIIILGHQNDMLGLNVPFTDLPYEVYGGGTMVVGPAANVKPFFKVAEDVTTLKLGAYKGQLRVIGAAGKTVADTREGAIKEKYDNTVEFDVVPGETYQLERECMYFRSYTPGEFFLAFTPERWFKPAPDLDNVKWWDLVK